VVSRPAFPPASEIASLPDRVPPPGGGPKDAAAGDRPAVRVLSRLRQPSPTAIAWIRRLACVAALIPLVRLGIGAFTGALGANPIEVITRATGEWTLILLLVTLAVTPARRLTGLNWLLRLRRMLGLTAFFYACLHLVTYLWLDQFFDLAAIARDIVKRPFITAGFTAFLLLLPLAITSTDAMVRRLGGRRWMALHRLVYLATAVGVLHYWWLVKADVSEPFFYAVILAILLAARVAWRFSAGRSPAPSARPTIDRTRR
jgi:methionine sulfoxide reductase heme-binding subunit